MAGAEAIVCYREPAKVALHPSFQAWCQDSKEGQGGQEEEVLVGPDTPKVVGKQEVCSPRAQLDSNIPPFLRLREKMLWWQRHGASQELLTTISEGIQVTPAAALGLSTLTIFPWEKSQEEITLAETVLSGYMETGAVQRLPIPRDRPLRDFCKSNQIHYLVPWFVISKAEEGGTKHRLISDCRKVNTHLQCNAFKMENWGHIFPYLTPKMWACKIDLKDAFFHLSLGAELRKYINLKVGQNIYRFLAAPFGLNILPELWTKTMKVLQRLWRKRGILCFLYLDDILIVNKNKSTLQIELGYILQSLKDAGLQINTKKSVLSPTQVIDHLGFQIDFLKGVLTVPPAKLKSVRKDLGKIVLAKSMSARKMAAILGQVRSFLQAIPALRSFTDLMLGFIRNNQVLGWDRACPIPDTMKAELKVIGRLLTDWPGRKLGKLISKREIHSDSSDFCWGGKDLKSGQIVTDYWRSQKTLHINIKELSAAVSVVKTLAKPGEHVSLGVDNLVAYYYLKKGGGRLPQFNRYMRDLWDWCLQKNITLTPHLVPSASDQADYLTRVVDKGDYTLNMDLFRFLKRENQPWVNPDWDMFASQGNKKFPNYVTRYPFWECSKTDSLQCPLEDIKECYANPPWTVIHQWLIRLKENPHLTCWVIVPFWASMSWWPLLAKMQVPGSPAIVIQPFQGMFKNCLEVEMPPQGGPFSP